MKTYEEINERIERKKAVVMTAEEIIGCVERKGVESAAREVDVVTTATFGPMCSSGCFLNFGHAKPRWPRAEPTPRGENPARPARGARTPLRRATGTRSGCRQAKRSSRAPWGRAAVA